MKTRILFLLLASCMVLSLAVPVGAAGTQPYQITLESCTEEQISVLFSPRNTKASSATGHIRRDFSPSAPSEWKPPPSTRLNLSL